MRVQSGSEETSRSAAFLWSSVKSAAAVRSPGPRAAVGRIKVRGQLARPKRSLDATLPKRTFDMIGARAARQAMPTDRQSIRQHSIRWRAIHFEPAARFGA